MIALDQTPSPAPAGPQPLGVAVVGFGWMGRVHAQAHVRAPHHFDVGLVPHLVAVADEVPGRADEAARRFGFAAAHLDWRDVLTDPRVQAVSVTAPNFLHREIGVAVAESGRHLWIEKPVGSSAADARAVADAVAAAGVQCAVGFNYRGAPAVQAARAMIAAGRIGEVTHARFRFLSDYAADPAGNLSWRYERARGGNGVLGDLGSHGVDLVHHLLGDVEAVVADTAVFVPRRALPTGATSGHGRSTGGVMGTVENEDHLGALLRMASGARVALEASRVAVGEQNNYGFEVHGTTGALFWDFRRMGELGVVAGGGHQDQPVATTFVGPGAGDYAAFQPGSANSMSFDDLKVVEAAGFLTSIRTGAPHGATAQDAVRAAGVLEALERSVASGAWVSPEPVAATP